MSENPKSVVNIIVSDIRKARTEAKLAEFFVKLAELTKEHSLTYPQLSAISGSLLLASVVEIAKSNDGSVIDATAAAFQVISDLTTNPEKMVDLWTKD